jgi:hypothetical protein
LANYLLTQPGFKAGDGSVVHELFSYSDVTQCNGVLLRQNQAF